MSEDSERRQTAPGVGRERRIVSRFSNPDLRTATHQIRAISNIIAITLAIVICDQIYLVTLDKSYLPKASFFSIISIMALFFIMSYRKSLAQYVDGESATSLVISFANLRNFLLFVVFIMVLFTGILLISQVH